MPRLETPEDVRRAFGDFFEELAANGGLDVFKDAGAVLGYESTQPPLAIAIDARGATPVVYVDDANAPAAQVTLRADARTFDRLLCGDLNPALALISGSVKIDGDAGVALRLMPANERIVPAYRAYRARLT